MALEGVDDLVVVATQDAVLVSRQKDANGLKRLVADGRAAGDGGSGRELSRRGRHHPDRGRLPAELKGLLLR